MKHFERVLHVATVAGLALLLATCKGDMGTAGPMGSAGTTGSTGATGADGATGPAGPDAGFKIFDWVAAPPLGSYSNGNTMTVTLPAAGNVLLRSMGYCNMAQFAGQQYVYFSLSTVSATPQGTNGAHTYIVLNNIPSNYYIPFAVQRVITGVPAGANTFYTVLLGSGQIATCYGTTTVEYAPTLLP